MSGLEEIPLHNPQNDLQQDAETLAEVEAKLAKRYAEAAPALQEMNLEQELAINFSRAKKLLSEILNDPNIPPNQTAQVMNTVTTILANITKLRTDLYNAERLKNIEAILIGVLKKQSKEVQEAFFSAYEAELEHFDRKSQ